MEKCYVSVREKPWKDLKDNNYVYKQGDEYPREGLEVSKRRIKELSTDKNKIGEILIKEVETENTTEEKKNKIEEVENVAEETELIKNDNE